MRTEPDPTSAWFERDQAEVRTGCRSPAQGAKPQG